MAGDHDPDNRRAFDWDRGTWNGGLLGYVRRCADARRRSVALRRGDFGTLRAFDRALVIYRKHGDSEAIVAVNAGTDAATVPLILDDSPLACRSWTPVHPDGGDMAAGQGSEVTLRVAPRSGQMWLSP
jgi:hypothetical protein